MLGPVDSNTPIQTIHATEALQTAFGSLWSWIFSGPSHEPPAISAEPVTVPNFEDFKTEFVRNKDLASSFLRRMDGEERVKTYEWLVDQNTGISDFSTFESNESIKTAIHNRVAKRCESLPAENIAKFAKAWGFSDHEKGKLFKSLMDNDQIGKAITFGKTLGHIPGVVQTLKNIENSISILRERILFRIDVLSALELSKGKDEDIPQLISSAFLMPIDGEPSRQDTWVARQEEVQGRAFSESEKSAYVTAVLKSETEAIALCLEKINAAKGRRSKHIQQEISSLLDILKNDQALIAEMESGRRRMSTR